MGGWQQAAKRLLTKIYIYRTCRTLIPVFVIRNIRMLEEWRTKKKSLLNKLAAVSPINE